MVRTWRSGKSLRRRALSITALSLLGWALSPTVARVFFVVNLLKVQSGDKPDGSDEIGFIGDTPRFIAPVAALLLAVLFEAATGACRRLRLSKGARVKGDLPRGVK